MKDAQGGDGSIFVSPPIAVMEASVSGKNPTSFITWLNVQKHLIEDWVYLPNQYTKRRLKGSAELNTQPLDLLFSEIVPAASTEAPSVYGLQRVPVLTVKVREVEIFWLTVRVAV